LDAECIDVGVVSWLVCCGHQVDCVGGAAYEEDLEDGVVGAIGEGPEEIEVASYVDDEIESLRLEGYS